MKNHVSTLKVIKEGYKEYTSDFGGYMQFSMIIFGFSLLDKLLKGSPILLILLLVNIYLTSRARISMNYKAYQSFLGIKTDFDEVWNYSKLRFWRFFGANIILGIVYILFFGIEYLLIMNVSSMTIKLFWCSIVFIVGVLTIGRIYCIDNIASITDSEESYFEINNDIIKGNYWVLVRIILISNIFLIPGLMVVMTHLNDLEYINNAVQIATFIYTFIDLFLVPIVNCIIIKFLIDAGFKKEITENKQVENIEIISEKDQYPEEEE
ncbi:hypothetical protein [Crassaminicella profunda]|uniref:hypothetical protein n=1 Tax=Crassaminicella profunda TaxID=1286698 RepID=UPI001CA65E83|nr:hypothetical protein [Crassaminicella profunda]QZY53920.1 hypothetical protein K7H06_12750 [Crassaminicella profunda]